MDSRVVCGQEAKAKTVILSGIAVTASQFLVIYKFIMKFKNYMNNEHRSQINITIFYI